MEAATEDKNSLLASSLTSAQCYRQPMAKTVIGYDQVPPESRGIVINMVSRNRVSDQLHSGSGFIGGLDRSTLSKLVPEKRLTELTKLGGVGGIGASLSTNLERGITGEEGDILHRTRAFGTNSYYMPPTKSFLSFVWEVSRDGVLVILLACAALSLGFGIKEHGLKEGWYDGGSIFFAVFLVIIVTAINNFKLHIEFEKVKMVKRNMSVSVVRNGRRENVSIFDIVVGDVVWLSIGDQVPADGLFITGYSLKVDESSITGESRFVDIDRHENPFLLSGSKVADGCAKMLVLSVGMNTSWGEMMSTINCDSDEETPLQARLNVLATVIGKFGLAVVFLALVVLLLRYFTGNTVDEDGNKEFDRRKTKADNVCNAVVGIIAATLASLVVAIPEGLPLAVTVTLAYSMKSMMVDRALVRKLPACETMGSATTICTHKTGSLTLNLMKVTKFWQGIESMEGRCYTSIANNVLELLHQGIGLNTTGSVYKSGVSGTNLQTSGSPTEKAILSWGVLELNMDMEAVKKSGDILNVEIFSSESKRSGVLMKKVKDKTCHVHWKGAAERILAMCSHYYDLEGNVKALNDHERTELDHIIEGMAACSLRCIAFAHKQVSEVNNVSGDGLTLLCLVGLKDPCRPGVKKAVEDCQYAGVNVRLITGENIFTAKAIATECGILGGPDQEANDESVVEGVQFRNYTEEERRDKVDKILVMARSSPSDKFLMVQCLKSKGHVVAVTGDDITDAPALLEADIGLAMGIAGTEVAKESSDIIVLDDNFASVVNVVRWGRCVFVNIQKFIQFHLTISVAAIVINFVAAVSIGKIPLTAAQLLWVNLIMDTFAALALATGKPSKELMYKPPRGRSDPLITNIMWRNIIGQALYQIAVILILEFKGKSIFGINQNVKYTLIFNTFVLCQVFNQFNARELEEMNVFKGILKSKLFLGITGITVILLVIIVEILNKLAHTERLDWMQWGVCIGIAAFSWPIGLLLKFLPVPSKPMLRVDVKQEWP